MPLAPSKCVITVNPALNQCKTSLAGPPLHETQNPPFAKCGRVWCNSVTRVVQHALDSVGQSDYSIQKDCVITSGVKPQRERSGEQRRVG